MDQLTQDQIKERMRLENLELVASIYDIVTRQVQAEVGRQTRLDAKATSLLTAAGVSVTLASVFGSTLAVNASRFQPWIVWPYSVAVACGLAAGFFSVWSLLVRDTYRTVSEEAVFDKESLEHADTQGLARYQRFMVVHLWMVYRENSAVHDRKALLIGRGQRFYLGFLATLLFVCVALLHGLIVVYGEAAANERSPAAEAGPGVPPIGAASPGPQEGRESGSSITAHQGSTGDAAEVSPKEEVAAPSAGSGAR